MKDIKDFRRSLGQLEVLLQHICFNISIEEATTSTQDLILHNWAVPHVALINPSFNL